MLLLSMQKCEVMQNSEFRLGTARTAEKLSADAIGL